MCSAFFAEKKNYSSKTFSVFFANTFKVCLLPIQGMEQKKVFFVLGEKPPHRVQSPSSISTFKQCPRKYYYAYVDKLPTLSSVATVRGTIVHSVLEKFFDLSVGGLSFENCSAAFKTRVQNLLVEEWIAHNAEFALFQMKQEERIALFEETLMMVFHWTENVVQKLKKQEGDFATAFQKLIPLREVMYESGRWHTRGVIDAIEQEDGKIRVMDYKTSNHTNVDEYRLQLGIYALLYFEKHGRLPDGVGIYFLKANQTHFIDVDEDLLALAKQEIYCIHEHTQSLEKKQYPRHISSLCKWSTGKCDFYDHCRADAE